MFPKLIKHASYTQISLQQKFVAKSMELILDRLRCVGCGICSRACPQNAIFFGPTVASYGGKLHQPEEILQNAIDETKCVFCGACTLFCPFDALHLFENGKKVERSENLLVIKEAIPHLEAVEFPMTRINRTAKIFWEGQTRCTFTFPESEKDFHQEYINKCPGDCRKCEEICPNDAISFLPAEEAWKTRQLLEIDENKCVACTACQLVCPHDNFSVTWTKVNHSGPYNAIFWDPLVQRLLQSAHVVNEPQEQSGA